MGPGVYCGGGKEIEEEIKKEKNKKQEPAFHKLIIESLERGTEGHIVARVYFVAELIAYSKGCLPISKEGIPELIDALKAAESKIRIEVGSVYVDIANAIAVLKEQKREAEKKAKEKEEEPSSDGWKVI
ncbi:hypothetical protein AMJ49_03870 [Parcubacteria bacterium DG_74_2]|nr:MAG: hypothetical protein AMJ49_03870 [Parcubacteria bacterium DG_74_2]